MLCIPASAEVLVMMQLVALHGVYVCRRCRVALFDAGDADESCAELRSKVALVGCSAKTRQVDDLRAFVTGCLRLGFAYT